MVDNNKNHRKTEDKTNAELRKMYAQAGSDIGIKNGAKISSHPNSKAKQDDESKF
jgi:hypothetical protein